MRDDRCGRPRRQRRPGRLVWLAGLLAVVMCGCASTPDAVLLATPSPGPPRAAGPTAQAGPVAAGPADHTGAGTGSARPAASGTSADSYAGLGARALTTLEREFYNGHGRWVMCVPIKCPTMNRDWGADSLTYILYLHWLLTGDDGVPRLMNALVATSPRAHSGVSDVPLWDSIAASREYQVTRNPEALAKAEGDFGYVAGNASRLFALGACPDVLYQRTGGGSTDVKTLETGANYIKAALLLYQITHRSSYLAEAVAQYQAVRRYFLAPDVPLYTVYVFDNGVTCQQVPAQFFASVNGTMIWDGYDLAQVTHDGDYLAEAIATARAVARYLGDGTGIYADLQAENDIAEPLVEGMYYLAAHAHQGFARRWLLVSANAAAASVAQGTGGFGRFFDGPPPRGAPVTAWQTGGGLALAVVSAALDPDGRLTHQHFWSAARFVPDEQTMGDSPVRLTFTGRAVAIIGTIGDVCCTAGHAQVLVDGAQTFDQTGIWQNKSSSDVRLPGSVLFAWRWPAPGRHTIEITPTSTNAKQGGSYFHMTGYEVVR